MGGLKRRRILLLLALVVVAAGIFICWPRGPKEPVYEGKRLSQWLEEAYNKDAPDGPASTLRALRAIGTNALPYLLSQFTQEDRRWIEGVKQWAGSRILRHQFQGQWKRRLMAFYGLQVLGPDAAPVLPELAKYLDEPARGGMVLSVMVNCGEPALPYLYRALDSTNGAIWTTALFGITRLTNGTDRDLQTLLRLMNHSNAWVRGYSTSILGQDRSQPERLVPPLIRALSERDPQVQHAAIDLLGGLGRNARSAIPKLLQLMNDADAKSALAASNAVFRIDRAALQPRTP